MYIKKLLVAVFVLGAIVLGIFSYYIYTAVFAPNTSFDESSVYVYISSDSNYMQVRDSLKTKLKNIDNFDAVAQKKGYVGNIKPGRYLLTNGMSNNDIVTSLRSKNIPINVSFNNQETIEKLAGRISQQIEADSLSLVEAMLDINYLSETGFDNETALAMYLPNTYEFYWNTSAKTFTERMHKEYITYWNESRLEKAKNQNLTALQVMSLAAIVQKETASVDERPRVAGVYLNRLKIGMLLQADPTVIYAIKKESDDFEQVIKRVLYRDLEIDSPYNTYKYSGVPHGLIAMPDVSAIEAVLNPEKHDYLFFVANVDKPGYHLFAKTLAQHNQNKIKYQQWINAQGVRR